MPEHTSRTLPLAASITHLKLEAKALRGAFGDGDAAAKQRVAEFLSPVPEALTQAKALFVLAREYGMPSWPALKRHVQRRTRTVFADDPERAEALATLLGGANVSIAETLEEAFGSTAEVLVLDLGRAPERKALAAAQVAALRARKIVVMNRDAYWFYAELDLEPMGGNTQPLAPIRVVDCDLLGPALRPATVQPLADPSATAYERYSDRPKYLSYGYVAEELRSANGRGYIELIAELPKEAGGAGVVTRQANCIFAGVVAPLADWSDGYRGLFLRMVAALAERPLEEFQPAIVPREPHAPGTASVQLAPLSANPADGYSKNLYFRFRRPTVFTATLTHRGSTSLALVFQGGPKQLQFVRVDAERGETLTIALTVTQKSIDAMGERYWVLRLVNFDSQSSATGQLTVYYNGLADGPIRALPSDASFEHFQWFAERLPDGAARTRREATAAAFGFDDWQTLQAHVAWMPVWLPGGGARGSDLGFRQAQKIVGGPLGLADLLAHATDKDEISSDLRQALTRAFDLAARVNQASVGPDHLLLALLDNATATDVLAKVGTDVERLRRDLEERIAVRDDGEPGGSRELFGVLWRANFHSALGRKGCNAANVLVGMFDEPSPGQDALRAQGIRQADVIRYLAHGIPKTLPPTMPSADSIVSREIEAALRGAFGAAAAQRHEAFGIEHLLLALVQGVPRPHDALRGELAAFVDATPRVARGAPRPTRALNRVMQKAVAQSRTRNELPVAAAAAVWAIATESRSFAADALRRHGSPLV